MRTVPSPADQTRGQLQDKRLSGTAFSDKNFRFCGSDGQGKAIQHVAFVETNAYVFKGNNGFAGCGGRHSG